MTPELQDSLLFVFGVFLSAFFSGSEAALLSIPAKRVKQLIEDSELAPGSAFHFLLERPSDLLTTILIGNNFVNIAVASLATTIAQRIFADDAISISVGVTTVLILIFGEIIPKTFMRNHAEKMAPPIIRILQLCYYSLFPIVKMFMFIIKSILGENAALQERLITKDDIEFMVGEAEKENSIDSKQIDLLTSILEFPTIKVKDIMTPRNSVQAIKIDSTFEEVVEIIKESQHSRYPVFQDDIDSTLGFIHVKDMALAAIEDHSEFSTSKYINDAFFVYEHMKIQAVFDHMNRKKVHLALVKDENALVVGIVTLEDIMEEIFGEIQDEYDDEEDINTLDEGESLEKGIILHGSINLRDLYNEYDIKIPLNDNYSTLRGFLLDMLGNKFPKEGNLLFWEGLSFELIKVIDEEIEDVKIESTDGARHITTPSQREEDEKHEEVSPSQDEN